MYALRTIQSVHGSKFSVDNIHNAHRHELPSKKARTGFDPYSRIQRQLENGQVFLINHMTRLPAITTLTVAEEWD